MLRYLTAGESHGPELTTIVEGLPAGLRLDVDELNVQLARRQVGYGSGGRMKIEQDSVRITSGFMNGMTTGGPIALHVVNRDFEKWRDRQITPITIPRPGHADLTGAIKYGYRELRVSLERASARETTMRVAVGAICKQLLAQFGIYVGSYVVSIGRIQAQIPGDMSYEARFASAEENDLRTPVSADYQAMKELIRECMLNKDTLGGVFEVVALNVPAGLGSHVHHDRRLSSIIMGSLGSIQAIKGVEIGPAFENALHYGTEVHDELYLDEDGETIRRYTNRAGGFEGGITTGEAVVARVAMKPISTVLNPRRSIDLVDGTEKQTVYERSDFCAVPRAAVVGEAMLAIPLAEALMEKLGGDSIDEMLPRFVGLRRARLSDLPMDNVAWNFGYKG